MNFKHFKFLTGMALLFAISYASAAPGSQKRDAHKHQDRPIKASRRSLKSSHTDNVVSKSLGLDRDEDDAVNFPHETLLSVQYEGGMIKELKVSQSGGDVHGEVAPHTWKPSVLDKQRLCAELCDAGLGGDPCGPSCPGNIVELLHDIPPTKMGSTSGGRFIKHESKEEVTVTESENVTTVDVIGNPRFEVCPQLCENDLGRPLCSCAAKPASSDAPSWSSICSAFCHSPSPYRPGGCPACQETEVMSPLIQTFMFAASNSDIWVQWCSYQCRRGDGGAACNCDQAPLF